LYNNFTYLPIFVVENEGLILSRKSKFGWHKIKTTKNYIFTQKSSKTLESPIKAIRMHISSNEIIVYDWDGKAQYKLILDHDIITFTINEDESLLYAIANIPEPVIIRYDLGEIW
jgi:hypothetical protein